MKFSPPMECYGLRWANGQRWNILVSEEVSAFLEAVIAMSGLSQTEHDDAYRLVLQARMHGNGNDPFNRFPVDSCSGLPRHGWFKEERSYWCHWCHADRLDALCEIDLSHGVPKEGHDSEEDHAFFSVGYWRVSCLFAPILLGLQAEGGLHLHGGLVEYDGIGVLLSGPSNVGKSTACRRLPPTWKVYCDDHAVVVRGADDSYRAHPLPTWSDYCSQGRLKVYDIQQSIPLHAIFFLEQAEKDEVIPLGKGATSARIFQAASEISWVEWTSVNNHRKRRYQHMVADSASLLAKGIPGYMLRVSLAGRFWEGIEEVLDGLAPHTSGALHQRREK